MTDHSKLAQHIPFKVFNASAGAGKTFTLVKEYLRLCLQSGQQSDYYKSILAITFTNKAAGEMKERILSGLREFAQAKTKNGMFDMLCKELNIPAKELQRRAQHVLEAILHDYSGFSISTIDKFTHKIIRTFAHDLKLPVNFELETDSDKLLEEAVDLLISRAGSDKKLTELLVRFTESKTNEDKSWHIEFDLMKIARLLLDEKSHSALKKLQENAIDDFLQLKKNIQSFIDDFCDKISDLTQQTLQLLQEYQINEKSFSYGDFPKYMRRLSKAKNIRKYSDFKAGKRLNKNIDEDKWYTAKTPAAEKQAIDSISNELKQVFLSIQQILEEDLSAFILYSEINKNLYALAVLNEIEKQLEELKTKNNILHISEFNKKIAGIIEDEPVPFIYERIGEKYTHYFIDEFQDTSRLQWKNLLPLVENAMASVRGGCLIVGDGKQAIYRWRGGEVEQFLEISSEEGLDNKILLNEDSIQNKYLKDIQNLPRNWRSFNDIIQFNNDFFASIATLLPDPKYQQLYQQAFQEKAGKEGGYTEINFVDYIDRTNYNESNLQQTYQHISSLIEEGFELRDIAIITRNNRQGSELASFLMHKEIPVISSESLLISSSPSVQFLIAVVRYLLNHKDKSARTQIIEFLRNREVIEVHKDQHLFFKDFIHCSAQKFEALLRENDFDFSTEKLQQLSIYESFEELIRIFKLFDKPDSYLQFFLDLVLRFSHKKNNTFSEFLEWWNEQQNKHSIVIPEGTNAVRLMTIHKSKGLEFPVVIFPFANWQAEYEREASEWIETNESLLEDFQTLLLPMNKHLEDTPYAEAYQKYQSKVVLDNINLLYVVLTRAVQRMYIISSTDRLSGNLSQYFVHFLTEKGLWNPAEQQYHFGTKTAAVHEERTPEDHFSLEQFITDNWRKKISISLLAPTVWETETPDIHREKGTIIHHALALCETKTDVDTAINHLLIEGMINKSEEKSLTKVLQKIVQHPELTNYFAPGLSIRNEAQIMSPDGTLLRPDRVVIHSPTKASIIDYKTGKSAESHRKQVDTYAQALEALGYQDVEKILVYIPSLKIDKNWNTQYTLF